MAKALEEDFLKIPQVLKNLKEGGLFTRTRVDLMQGKNNPADDKLPEGQQRLL